MGKLGKLGKFGRNENQLICVIGKTPFTSLIHHWQLLILCYRKSLLTRCRENSWRDAGIHKTKTLLHFPFPLARRRIPIDRRNSASPPENSDRSPEFRQPARNSASPPGIPIDRRNSDSPPGIPPARQEFQKPKPKPKTFLPFPFPLARQEFRQPASPPGIPPAR